MITTRTQIKEVGHIRTIEDNFSFTHWALLSEQKLRKALGNNIVNACIAHRALIDDLPEGVTPPTPTGEAAKFELVSLLDALWILYDALPAINTVYGNRGGIMTTGESDAMTIDYLSPADIAERRREYMTQCNQLISAITGRVIVHGGRVEIVTTS